MESHFMSSGSRSGSINAPLLLTGATDNAFDMALEDDEDARMAEMERDIKLLKGLMRVFIMSELG